METFSAYVSRLGADGKPPDTASYEEVREELRGVLVRELHRRSLWTAPTHYLGLSGSNWGQGALDELVTDAYTFIFVRRLRGLRKQQRLQGNIRSLVYLNVGHLITELQKKADPLGYRVFGRLRAAVEIGVERGEIFVQQPEPKKKQRRLRNGTILSFQPGLAPLTARESFEEIVQRWNEDLLPDLITAEGRAVPKVVENLAEKVLALKEEGVAAFRFGHLIRELKADVRRRWQDAWRQSLGELGTEPGEGDDPPRAVQVVPPEEEPDWNRRLAQIEDCVATSIDAERPPKSRRDLWSLWLHLRTTRVLPGDHGPLPAFAELGRQLKLTRDRVRQLFERLRPIVLECLRIAGRRAGPPQPRTTKTPDDPRRVGAEERRRPRIARRGR